MAYTPPEGDGLGFDFVGVGYVAPEGDSLAFNFTIRPPYIPPEGAQVALSFSGAYSPPSGRLVGLEFVRSDGPVANIQYVFPAGSEQLGAGEPYARNNWLFLGPEAIPSGLLFGLASLRNNTTIARPSGTDAARLGIPAFVHTRRPISPSGISAALYGRPVVFNLRQYLRPSGHLAHGYGVAYVQGGVKNVTPAGYSAAVIGRPTLLNTTAEQAILLAGIASLAVGRPNVSPRTIFPFGVGAWAIGTPWVQRNPSPAGWDSLAFGLPAIEYWTKYLEPGAIAPEDLGYPAVFDPTQKLFPPSVLRSTVFGDVGIVNQSRFIRVAGADFFEGSDWAVVQSNRRYMQGEGWIATLFGATAIRNRWPSIAPSGFDALRPASPAETGIGYSVRYVEVPGIYRTLFGQARLSKTPAIEPKGFAGAIGLATIWPRVRNLEARGSNHQSIPAPNVWFRYRYVPTQGFAAGQYGTPKLEHSRRWLLAHGSSHLLAGVPRVGNLNRTLSPLGIFEDFASGHMVGGDRWLRPVGFDAARFGARIIPESQSLYPLGFAGTYGWPTFWNYTQQVAPAGITTGVQPADRWGTARVFSSRQYVSLYFDPDSQLNPPAWPQWTRLENRNKSMRTAGHLSERVAIPAIANNARPIHPPAIQAPGHPDYYQAGMVAYRIRRYSLEGVEAPYLSTWARIYNDAFVLAPAGFVASQFGAAALESNRRYFPYIGGFDVSGYGYPLVADRIRTLSFEGRYTIGSPAVPLPVVKLYTRYVDPLGSDLSGYGWASLSIHWTLITPRWTHQSLFGWGAVKNLTPELGTRGRNSEEFGESLVRLQWRPVNPDGANAQLFGRSQIADRDRTLHIPGWRTGAIGDKLRVIRMGAPPYSEQTISLRGEEAADGSEREGNGIPPPGDGSEGQMGRPIINQQVVYVRQIDPHTLYGSPVVTANSIRVEPGYWEQLVGDPLVALKIRRVTAGPFGNDQVYVPSPARLTPHTIWAVKEAPEQARRNHPDAGILHYVDENPNGGWRKGIGRPAVSLQHRSMRAYSVDASSYGRPRASNRRSYIQPEGIRSYRFGWHLIPGPQDVTQFDSTNTQAFGRPSLAPPPYFGPQTIRGAGFSAVRLGVNEIQLWNRQLRPTGHLSTLMGTRRAGDTPFMWQGLRIGEHIPFFAGGFETMRMGQPWVSFRVRGVDIQGWDSFISEYQLEMFDERMRVRRIDPPRPFRTLDAVGLDHSATGVPNVIPGVHYIRPDGNADQYRKGAF